MHWTCLRVSVIKLVLLLDCMISVTMLSAYLYCSRKLFLERVLKLREPPKESLVLGSLRHHVFEYANEYDERIVKTIRKEWSLSKIQSLYRTAYEGVLHESIAKNSFRLARVKLSKEEALARSASSVESEAMSRAAHVHSFILKHKVFGDALWDTLTPKIVSEKRVSSKKLGLRGIVDQIHQYDDKTVIPFELKTGSAPDEGVWSGHRVQIVSYAMLLEELMGGTIKEGHVRYLDSGDDRIVHINPMMREEVLSLTKEVTQLLRSMELPDFCESERKCAGCGLREVCYDEDAMKKHMDAFFSDKLRQTVLTKSI